MTEMLWQHIHAAFIYLKKIFFQHSRLLACVNVYIYISVYSTTKDGSVVKFHLFKKSIIFSYALGKKRKHNYMEFFFS